MVKFPLLVLQVGRYIFRTEVVPYIIKKEIDQSFKHVHITDFISLYGITKQDRGVNVINQLVNIAIRIVRNMCYRKAALTQILSKPFPALPCIIMTVMMKIQKLAER